MSNDCKFKTHVSSIVSRANRSLGIIKKSFVSRDVNLYVTLYRSFVRPVSEYYNIVRCLHQVTLCDQIEAVQKRFNRLFPDMRNMQNRSRLTKLNLLSLRARR